MTNAEINKLVAAYLAGAEYYGVAYATGVSVRSEGGSNIAYDHNGNIVTSNVDRTSLDKAIAKAKDKANRSLNH